MSLRILTLAGVLVGAVAWTAATNRPGAIPVSQTVVQHANVVPVVEPTDVKPAARAKKSPTHFHTAAVRAFGETPGFGLGRMKITIQEVEDIFVDWSPGELEIDGPPIQVPELAKVHRASAGVLGADPRLWPAAPVMVSSVHVGAPAQHWRLQKIDLIALVDHDEPAVYITAKLPLPNEHGVVAKKTVQDKARYTRALDFLEIAALEKLMTGDELYIRTKENALRMIGALRASKQCLECHNGKEGDLFGAFSYSLEKVAR